jgi:hypothetical protein
VYSAFQAGKVLGSEQRAGAAALREGFKRIGHADIAAHPVVRRNLRPAIKAIAQVEIAAGHDISGHRLDPECAEQARVDADRVELAAVIGDFRQRSRKGLGAATRQAAQHNDAASLGDIVRHGPQGSRRHRERSKSDEAGRFTQTIAGHGARVGHHLVEVEDVVAVRPRGALAGLLGVALAMRLGFGGAVIGLAKDRFGPRAGTGGKRIGFARLDLGAGAYRFEIEFRLARLCCGSRHSGRASDRRDYKEMREYFHSAQQFRLRQTR